MSTLTMMQRTADGWRCSRCGSTAEDCIIPASSVECNCEGLGIPALPSGLSPVQSQAFKALLELTDAERVMVFCRFCTHCGSKNPDCQCWNDE